MTDPDTSEPARGDVAEPAGGEPAAAESEVAAAIEADAVASSSWWRWCIVAGVAIAVLAIDQLSKNWALDRLANGQIIDVIWTLRFNLAFNTGMAFSKGSGSGAIIGIVVLVVVVVLLFVARKMRSRFQLVLVGLIVGGALGNLLDRLFRAPLAGQPDGFMRGAVVDFIDVQFWPIWNVADMAVVCGAIALALFGLRADPYEDEPNDGDPALDGPAVAEVADHAAAADEPGATRGA